MSHDPMALAVEAMNPQELEAAQFADAYYGAQAKLEAARLLEKLGLEENVALLVLNGLSSHLAEMDFAQKNETAEHFKGISALCGSVAVRPQVHLAAVHTEPEAEQPSEVMAADEPTDQLEVQGAASPTVEDEIEPEVEVEVEPAEPELEPVVPYKFNHYEKTYLFALFGNSKADIITGLSKEQFKFLLTGVTEHYKKLSITRLSKDAKQKRADILISLLYDRADAGEVAAKYGVTTSALSQGNRKMITSIQSRTKAGILADLLDDAAAFRPSLSEVETSEETIKSSVKADVSQNSRSDASIEDSVQDSQKSDPRPEQVRASLDDEPRSLDEVLDAFADFMRFDRTEAKLMKRIFDVVRRTPDLSSQAKDVRETLSSLYKVVKSSSQNELTKLEINVLDKLLDNPNYLTAYSVQQQLYVQLRDEKTKIQDALRSGLEKIIQDRERVLGRTKNVVAG